MLVSYTNCKGQSKSLSKRKNGMPALWQLQAFQKQKTNKKTQEEKHHVLHGYIKRVCYKLVKFQLRSSYLIMDSFIIIYILILEEEEML